MPTMIASWFLTVSLIFGGYKVWESKIKPSWKGMLNDLAYAYVTVMLASSTLLIATFVC